MPTWNKNKQFTKVSSRNFLNVLRDIFQAKGYFSTAGRAFHWGVHGNIITQKIIDYMYKDATIWLDRKKETCHALL